MLRHRCYPSPDEGYSKFWSSMQKANPVIRLELPHSQLNITGSFECLIVPQVRALLSLA